MLGVAECDERLVARQRPDVQVLGMMMHARRRTGVVAAGDPHVEAVVTGDPGRDDVTSEGEALRPPVGDAVEKGIRRRGAAVAIERGHQPVAALVAGHVVEPHDAVAVGCDAAGHHADGLVRDRPSVAACAIPRLHLPDAALVGRDRQTVGRVAGPRGEADLRRPEPSLPVVHEWPTLASAG